MYEHILYEVADPVATITLNRPERLNAISQLMAHEIRHALAQAEQDARVVGIIITGAGRAFSAGADMTTLENVQASGTTATIGVPNPYAGVVAGDPAMGPDYQLVFTYLLTVRKPIIAAINGPCAGYAFSLACFSDLRFMAENAYVVTSYSPRALVAEHGTSWILPRLIGPARALDVLWSSRRFGGAEAAELGIANRVLPGEELLPAARQYIRLLAETVAPSSLQVMKWQVYRQLSQTLGQAAAETHELAEQSYKRPDFREGIDSFRERRSPRFPRVAVPAAGG